MNQSLCTRGDKQTNQHQKNLLQQDVNSPLGKENLSWSKGCTHPQVRSTYQCSLKASSVKVVRGVHNPAPNHKARQDAVYSLQLLLTLAPSPAGLSPGSFLYLNVPRSPWLRKAAGDSNADHSKTFLCVYQLLSVYVLALNDFNCYEFTQAIKPNHCI